GAATRLSDVAAVTNFINSFGMGATDAATAPLGLLVGPGPTQQICIGDGCVFGANATNPIRNGTHYDIMVNITSCVPLATCGATQTCSKYVT
ncbi:hypothetical protein ABTN20_19740, partial [Acinetobacter baumannii]